MPWLPFYAASDDLPLVNAALFTEGDIAPLLPAGGDRWTAAADHVLAADGRYPLWHVPSGPLPLMPAGLGDEAGVIENPFAGWTQLRITDGEPYFGNHAGLFWLNLRIAPRDAGAGIGLSSVEWIGNHFWALGREAPPATKKRWDKLRRHFARLGPKVPRGGTASGRGPEIFALPAALAALEANAAADVVPG